MISGQALRRHEAAQSRIEQGLRSLEDLYLIGDWRPDAAIDQIQKNGVYFTPIAMAVYLAEMLVSGNRFIEKIVDLGAGIGILTWACWYFIDREGLNDQVEFICVERNPVLAAEGRKVCPFAEWIEGDMFDERVIAQLEAKGPYTFGVSNPPYGVTVSTWYPFDTLSLKNSELLAAELLLKLTCFGGGMILPINSILTYDSKKFYDKVTKTYGGGFTDTSIGKVYSAWERVTGGSILPLVTSEEMGMSWRFVNAPGMKTAVCSLEQGDEG